MLSHLIRKLTHLPEDPQGPSLGHPHPIPSTVVTRPSEESESETESPDREAPLADEELEISPALEREICLAINRELHVSYCYLTMSGMYTRCNISISILLTFPTLS